MGPVASMGFSNMTTASHDHYQSEPLAQVSFGCKAAIKSIPPLQAKGLEEESKASSVIAIPSSSYDTHSYDTVDHAPLLHAQIQSPLHDATCKSTALATLAYQGIEQFRQSTGDTCANARLCCHLCSQSEVVDFRASRDRKRALLFLLGSGAG